MNSDHSFTSEHDYMMKTIGLPRLLSDGVAPHLSGSISRAMSGLGSNEDNAILHSALRDATYNYRPSLRLSPLSSGRDFLSGGSGGFLR